VFGSVFVLQRVQVGFVACFVVFLVVVVVVSIIMFGVHPFGPFESARSVESLHFAGELLDVVVGQEVGEVVRIAGVVGTVDPPFLAAFAGAFPAFVLERRVRLCAQVEHLGAATVGGTLRIQNVGDVAVFTRAEV